MKFDKENVIIICITIAVIVAWALIYPKYQKERAEERARIQQEKVQQYNAQPQVIQQTPVAGATTDTVQDTKAAVAANKNLPTVAIPVSGQRYFTISNDLVEAKVDVQASALETITLKKFKVANAKEEKQVVTSANTKYKSLQPVLGDAKCISAAAQKINDASLQITSKWSNGLNLIQQISLQKGSYLIDVQYTFVNPGKNLVTVPEFLVWSAGVPPTQYLAGDKIYSERHNIDWHIAGAKSIVTGDPEAKEAKFKNLQTEQNVDWVGSTNKFFASILFLDKVNGGVAGGMRVDRSYHAKPEKPSDQYVQPYVGLALKNITLPAGQSMTVSAMRYYFGPKEMNEISKLPPTVMDAMHISYFSWFEFLARPMVRFLVWMNSHCNSYGLAIIILTLIVRLIFWPITQKANTSMRKMSKLKPKMDEIREKYKSNPQEMNMRMMELYRTEKVSPLGGCLPILLQIPVFFALYSALDSAVELRQVSFLWAEDLARPDLIGPQIDLPFFGPTGLHPLVIAMTLLMVLQQKMTPSNMDPAQQKVMMLMPVIMLFMLYNLPSGLTLYWTVSQIFSILQMKYGQKVAEREEAKAAAAGNAK